MTKHLQRSSLISCYIPDETKKFPIQEEKTHVEEPFSETPEINSQTPDKLFYNDSSPTTASQNISIEQEIDVSPPDAASASSTPYSLRFHDANQYTTLALIIASWYIISMTITALNKCLFDTLRFNFPLLVTFVHFMCISVCLLIVCSHPKCYHRYPITTRRNYWKCIVPIAICGSLEVAMSNLAYAMVSLSIMTVMKSMLVVVTYVVAILAGLDKFSWKLFLTVLVTVGSIALTVQGMEIRNPIGLLFLSTAVFAGAVRWVISSYQIREQRYTPWQMMFLTQPVSTMCLAPPAFFIDFSMAVESIKTTYSNEESKQNLIPIVALIAVTVILAALLISVEYKVLERISSVSLTLAGIGKEILTILMSVTIFGEHVHVKTCIGIASSIAAIIAYSKIRLSMNQNDSMLVEKPEKDSFVTISTQPSAPELSAASGHKYDPIFSPSEPDHQSLYKKKMKKIGKSNVPQYSSLGIEVTTSTAFTEHSEIR